MKEMLDCFLLKFISFLNLEYSFDASTYILYLVACASVMSSQDVELVRLRCWNK